MTLAAWTLALLAQATAPQATQSQATDPVGQYLGDLEQAGVLARRRRRRHAGRPA